MKNFYGVTLDSNGYAPSLISKESCCFVCHKPTIVRHEIFHGSNRQKSKQYGLWLNLCPDHHKLLHDYPDVNNTYQKLAQVSAMHEYGWSKEDFIKIIGKNYLEEEEC